MLEAVLLIIHITAGHTDIQKSVTFSDAFERIFAIVELEGGVDGGIVVQDCLHLLSNLLSANVSNASENVTDFCMSVWPAVMCMIRSTASNTRQPRLSPAGRRRKQIPLRIASRLSSSIDTSVGTPSGALYTHSCVRVGRFCEIAASSCSV